MEFISSIYSESTQVQLVLTTHSPILLSDFPSENIIYLDKNNKHTLYRDVGTFASNIHSLFLDAFFLDKTGTIGSFAEEKINSVVRMLRAEGKPSFSQKEIENTIHCVGDELIRSKLMELYDKKYVNNQIFENKDNKQQNEDYVHEENKKIIQLLKEQKQQIELMIEELENY